jgi:hypothetical protein
MGEIIVVTERLSSHRNNIKQISKHSHSGNSQPRYTRVTSSWRTTRYYIIERQSGLNFFEPKNDFRVLGESRLVSSLVRYM